MNNKDKDKSTYDEVMALIDKIKMYSGCDEVKLAGNDKAFEKLLTTGFSLDGFERESVSDMWNEPMLYIMPVE
jgi:hypothetical protein